MRVAIIRCARTEKNCMAGGCINTINNGTGSLKNIDEKFEFAGMISCGGCPGDNVKERALMLKNKPIDAIMLSTCVTKTISSRSNPTCLYQDKMIKEIKEAINSEITFFEYSHD